eukprot:296615-Prymnesium_polylepis.1
MTLERTLRLPTMFDSTGWHACKNGVELLDSLVERARSLVSGVDASLLLALLHDPLEGLHETCVRKMKASAHHEAVAAIVRPDGSVDL